MYRQILPTNLSYRLLPASTQVNEAALVLRLIQISLLQHLSFRDRLTLLMSLAVLLALSAEELWNAAFQSQVNQYMSILFRMMALSHGYIDPPQPLNRLYLTMSLTVLSRISFKHSQATAVVCLMAICNTLAIVYPNVVFVNHMHVYMVHQSRFLANAASIVVYTVFLVQIPCGTMTVSTVCTFHPCDRLTALSKHLEGLIRWRIVFHGFIDGFSRFITGIRAHNNNRAQTVLDLFLDIIEVHGIPSRLRGDHGTENILVAAHAEQLRGVRRGSYIWGR